MNFDDVKKLQQKKYREQFGFFLAEGEHLVLELQKALNTNSALNRSELYVTEKYADWQSPLKTHVITERQMAQLAETKTPQGIIAMVPILSAQTMLKSERAIYLHEVQDPGNLGTILRTLGWFGGFRCLLSPGSVDPCNSKAVRASMGAIFHVPIELDVDIDALQQRFARIAFLDMQGEAIQSPAFSSFDCYVFGNEARGAPCDRLISIAAHPFTIAGSGVVDSLNLATAVNICAYELSRAQILDQ